MASPHTAGLLAYLLSLQGSETFNPVFDSKKEVYTVSSWNPTGAIMAVLPRWMSAFIPANLIEDVIPSESDDQFYNDDGTLDVTQFGGITPAQLKGALIDLGLPDKLNDLPPKTINLLIFNNATDSKGHPWRK
jgi:cerevisin